MGIYLFRNAETRLYPSKPSFLKRSLDPTNPVLKVLKGFPWPHKQKIFAIF